MVITTCSCMLCKWSNYGCLRWPKTAIWTGIYKFLALIHITRTPFSKTIIMWELHDFIQIHQNHNNVELYDLGINTCYTTQHEELKQWTLAHRLFWNLLLKMYYTFLYLQVQVSNWKKRKTQHNVLYFMFCRMVWTLYTNQLGEKCLKPVLISTDYFKISLRSHEIM